MSLWQVDMGGLEFLFICRQSAFGDTFVQRSLAQSRPLRISSKRFTTVARILVRGGVMPNHHHYLTSPETFQFDWTPQC
jgi:hypothetical protein